MTFPQIQKFIHEECPLVEPKLGDYDFALPTDDWVTGAFLRSWRELCISENLVYQPGKFDCENFAEKCSVHARDCHRKTSGHSGQGLAFGEFWYEKAGLGAHGICVWITTTADGKPAFRFLEPQPAARQIFLTPGEIKSCTELFFS